MRDARTGEILVGGEQMGSDNGRGTSDDIDPRYPGCEGWSAAGIPPQTVPSFQQNTLCRQTSYAIGTAIWAVKFRTTFISASGIPKKEKVETIFTASGCTSVNGTKANPSLTADLFGDWREEVMYPLKDGSAFENLHNHYTDKLQNPYTYARHSIQNARCIPKRLLQSAYTPKLLSWF